MSPTTALPKHHSYKNAKLFFIYYLRHSCHHDVTVRIHRFSAANFAKYRGTICEILHYYPQTPYIPQPLGTVVLIDNTSNYK